MAPLPGVSAMGICLRSSQLRSLLNFVFCEHVEPRTIAPRNIRRVLAIFAILQSSNLQPTPLENLSNRNDSKQRRKKPRRYNRYDHLFLSTNSTEP